MFKEKDGQVFVDGEPVGDLIALRLELDNDKFMTIKPGQEYKRQQGPNKGTIIVVEKIVSEKSITCRFVEPVVYGGSMPEFKGDSIKTTATFLKDLYELHKDVGDEGEGEESE